jgi:hypothetical protein
MTISKHYSLFSISFLVLLFLAIELSTAQVPSDYPAMTNEGADEMAMTYAFYMGQQLSVQKIVSNFPELSNAFNRVQAEFDKIFKPAIDNIDAILSIENTRWSSSKTNIINSLQSEISTLSFTENEAKEFLELIEDRVNGDIPEPILETLLIYNPKYLKQPALEFLEGFRQVFSTKDHPKSKGVNFQIEYPFSWKAREGVRPNIITLITGENGRGFENISLLVNELGISETEAEQISMVEIREIFQDNFVKELTPINSRLISWDHIELDGLPGIAIVFDIERRQLDMDFISRNMHYIIIYKNKMIFIQFSVSLDIAKSDHLNDRFDKFKTLFRLVANSFVVQDQW